MKTERLILRRFTEADADNLYRLDSDPEVMRWLNGGAATPRDAIRDHILPRFLQEYDRYPGFGHWAALERASGKFAGWFGLTPAADEPQTAELGYRMQRTVWGKGYATEGSHALIYRAFTELDICRVSAVTYAENLASRRVMEKVGMSLVRTFRMTPEELQAHATFVVTENEIWDADDVEYALDRAEWERRQRQ